MLNSIINEQNFFKLKKHTNNEFINLKLSFMMKIHSIIFLFMFKFALKIKNFYLKKNKAIVFEKKIDR